MAYLRYILLFLFLFLGSSCLTSWAQEPSQSKRPRPATAEVPSEPKPFKPRFMIGATGGANLSSMTFQPKVQQGKKLGYDAGVILRYDVTSYAGIWLEVDYSERGWKELPEDYPEYEYERTLKYLHLPVLTHFMVGSGPLKITVDAGAHFGYLLGESSRSTFPAERPGRVVVRQHTMPVEHKVAWGLGGGVGLEYHVGRHIVAGLRGSYVYGLGDIYGNSRKDYFGMSNEQIYSAKAFVFFGF